MRIGQLGHEVRRPHFVDVDMVFLCGPYVTGYSGQWTRTHRTVMILSVLLDRL